MRLCTVVWSLFALVNFTRASVTVWKQIPLPTETTTASGAAYTGPAAYDPTVLQAPPIPVPPPPTNFLVQLLNTSQQLLTSNATQGGLPGISVPQTGTFFGFSVEMSVISQVCEYP